MSAADDTEEKDEPAIKGKFRPETCDQAYELYLLGKTDEFVASFFRVATSTLQRWVLDRPEFREARENGKAKADGNVVRSLYRNATGFYYKKTVVSNSKLGPMITEIEEYMPPDTKAQALWLQCRQPELWSKQVEQSNQKAEQPSMIELAKFMCFALASGNKEQDAKLVVSEPVRDAVLIEQKQKEAA